MNKIKVLPEILANKIAAGEIVERPASVAKELIENSIDAGSRSIQVAIQAGGKRTIRVRDDGGGMSQDDAILAFEHHATSKLETAEDLNAIATLGFRGEALPSIASVSRLTLRTRAEDSDSVPGTELEIQGGILRSVKPVPWDRGTEIAVRDLFFNVPARRKFLKTNDTETGHIARLVTQYALAHPEIRFSLESRDRTLLDTVAVSSLRDRIYQLFGDGFLDNLVEFDASRGPVRVYGFSSRPHEQRQNAYSQYFFINRRMVRDKVISGAVRQAYRRSMPSSSYPVVILFLELPFDRVDVNAHPAKTEVRFHDQKTVFGLVQETIERAVSADVAIPEFYSGPARVRIPDFPERDSRERPGQGEIPEAHAPGQRITEYSSGNREQPSFSYPNGNRNDTTIAIREDPAATLPVPEIRPRDKGSEAGGLFQSETIRILGQFRNSYIVAYDSRGLLIIDQHVAHERILYEKLAGAIRDRSVESQGLLTPISLELAPQQISWVEKAMPELEASGFQVEPFGGTSILIRAVPAIARESDCRELVKEILENLDEQDRGLDIEKLRDRIAVRTACRAAIKVNTALSPEKMQWLVDALAGTKIPVSCPHGRPIILRFSNYEIEKMFGRV